MAIKKTHTQTHLSFDRKPQLGFDGSILQIAFVQHVIDIRILTVFLCKSFISSISSDSHETNKIYFGVKKFYISVDYTIDRWTLGTD